MQVQNLVNATSMKIEITIGVKPFQSLVPDEQIHFAPKAH
jgi:hypothetical protein